VADPVEPLAVEFEVIPASLVDYVVGLDEFRVLAAEPDRTAGAAGLLVAGEDQFQIAARWAPAGLGERDRCGDLAGDLTLHVDRPPAPDDPVDQISSPRIVLPVGGVGLDRIHMGEKGEVLARLVPRQSRHEICPRGLGLEQIAFEAG
jgi:hypothetical protein